MQTVITVTADEAGDFDILFDEEALDQFQRIKVEQMMRKLSDYFKKYDQFAHARADWQACKEHKERVCIDPFYEPMDSDL